MTVACGTEVTIPPWCDRQATTADGWRTAAGGRRTAGVRQSADGHGPARQGRQFLAKPRISAGGAGQDGKVSAAPDTYTPTVAVRRVADVKACATLATGTKGCTAEAIG